MAILSAKLLCQLARLAGIRHRKDTLDESSRLCGIYAWFIGVTPAQMIKLIGVMFHLADAATEKDMRLRMFAETPVGGVVCKSDHAWTTIN